MRTLNPCELGSDALREYPLSPLMLFRGTFKQGLQIVSAYIVHMINQKVESRNCISFPKRKLLYNLYISRGNGIFYRCL